MPALVGGGGDDADALPVPQGLKSVASTLTRVVGADVPVLGQVPIDLRLREAGDTGVPVVLSEPDSPAARQLTKIAHALIMQFREPKTAALDGPDRQALGSKAAAV